MQINMDAQLLYTQLNKEGLLQINRDAGLLYTAEQGGGAITCIQIHTEARLLYTVEQRGGAVSNRYTWKQGYNIWLNKETALVHLGRSNL